MIRIPREEIALDEEFGSGIDATEFGRPDKKQDSYKYVPSTLKLSYVGQRFTDICFFSFLTTSAFRELFQEIEMSMSLSMSFSPPSGTATTTPTSTPVPPADDPLDPDTDLESSLPRLPPVTTTDAPSSSPIGDAEGENQAAATSDKESIASSAPQTALISLVSLAVVALIVAMIARKVHVNRKAAMAGGKSLSDESAEDSMDPSTEPGTEPEADIVITTI
jgi:hypothetical protein